MTRPCPDDLYLAAPCGPTLGDVRRVLREELDRVVESVKPSSDCHHCIDYDRGGVCCNCNEQNGQQSRGLQHSDDTRLRRFAAFVKGEDLSKVGMLDFHDYRVVQRTLDALEKERDAQQRHIEQLHAQVLDLAKARDALSTTVDVLTAKLEGYKHANAKYAELHEGWKPSELARYKEALDYIAGWDQGDDLDGFDEPASARRARTALGGRK